MAWLLLGAAITASTAAEAAQPAASGVGSPGTVGAQPAEDPKMAAARQQYEAMQAVSQEYAAWMQQATAEFAEKMRAVQTPAERTALQQAFQQEQQQKLADMQRRLDELKAGMPR